MHHSSMSWEISILYFFGWNFIWFLQKESTTVQNFGLLTDQVKFHQIFTLIGYFCWKYIKFQLQKVWRSYVSWYQRMVQNLKRNLLFVSKMTKNWWILIRVLKSLKNFRFDLSLLCKLYNVWPKKVQRSIFYDTEESCKIWRKTDSWFGKWQEEFGKFSSGHLKMSKLVFSSDPLLQSRKFRSYILTEEL